MEFSFNTVGITFFGNILVTLVMIFLQEVGLNIKPRHDIIPDTNQKFLYMEDFLSMTAGIVYGLTPMWIVWAHLPGMSAASQLVAKLVGAAAGLGFLATCLSRNHKPDWGFPERGLAGGGGVLTTLYLGASCYAATQCFWAMCTGVLTGWFLITAWTGSVVWAFTLAVDAKRGHFAPYTPI